MQPLSSPGSPGRLDSPMPTSVPHTGTDLCSIPLPFSPSSLPGISLDSNACLSDCLLGKPAYDSHGCSGGSWDWIPGEKDKSKARVLISILQGSPLPQETVCIPGWSPLWLPHPPWPHQWDLEASSSLLGCPLGCQSWEGRDWDVGPVWHPEECSGPALEGVRVLAVLWGAQDKRLSHFLEDLAGMEGAYFPTTSPGEAASHELP